MSSRPLRSLCAVALLFAWTAHADPARTWRTVDALTEDERARVDLREPEARDRDGAYMPEERYPFSAPYTAEQIGYHLMNFSHIPHWDIVLADVFGSVTKEGYLTQGITIGTILNEGPNNATSRIDSKPGDVYQRWNYFYTYPPKNDGLQELWLLKRTGPEQPTKLDYFIYSPSLRRVRRQAPPRRDSQFPNSVQSFDDIVGLEAWEFRWKLVGADILYETVRFPVTRPVITLAQPDGTFFEKKTSEIKMMGEAYPFYREDGGIDTFVVVATPRRDWLPTYQIATIVFWVDQQYFYPLRIEQYDAEGDLRTLQTRIADRQNPNLPGGEGYTNPHSVYWDADLDLTTYSAHDALLLHEWTDGEAETLFNPDFMRRRWQRHGVKSQVLIERPDQFHLRPRIYADRFPEVRRIILDDDVAARIAAQNAAGRHVFTGETEGPEPGETESPEGSTEENRVR